MAALSVITIFLFSKENIATLGFILIFSKPGDFLIQFPKHLLTFYTHEKENCAETPTKTESSKIS